MFKNRISVVSRARNVGKGSSLQLSSSADENNSGGDKPTLSPCLMTSLPSGYGSPSVSTAVAIDKVSTMEVSDSTNLGVCVKENFFAIDDSGEIRENELLLEDDEDGDITKDLDFASKPSPSLFSVTSSSTPRTRLPIGHEQTIGNGFAPNITKEFEELSAQQSNMNGMTTHAGSASDFLVPEGAITPLPVNRWVVPETPETTGQLPGKLLPVDSVKITARKFQRRSISSAIDDLNEMSAELLQFVKSFEEKYAMPKQ
ncbi:uncharacterized protein LOC131264150 [Anopheles coustani]|uniref:uncharacterized protein LOC131264150 n=1 Tax=Anopheles coustani TaxID=139045 RepID=UPI0026581303|nr:uncharacterized protein LOC131264150 [Anopheles coustani]